jgi:hypothetical protein
MHVVNTETPEKRIPKKQDTFFFHRVIIICGTGAPEAFVVVCPKKIYVPGDLNLTLNIGFVDPSNYWMIFSMILPCCYLMGPEAGKEKLKGYECNEGYEEQ